MTCPNKNDSNWKKLVELIGEEAAMAAYIKNNETIPNFEDYKNPEAVQALFSPKDQAIAEAYREVVVPGFNVDTQSEAINHIFEQIVLAIDKSPGVSFNQAMTLFVNFAEKQVEKGNKKYDAILDNIDVFRTLVKDRLDRIGIIERQRIDPNLTADQKILVGEDEVIDSFYWSDDWVFKFDVKSNAQKSIKKFLSFIPKTGFDESEGYYEIGNYLNTISYMPYDEVFEDLKAILAGVSNNWTAMKAELETTVEAKPWVYNLLTQIETHPGDKQELINQFVTTFASTYNNFKTLLYEEDKGNLTFKLIDTDQNSIVKTILSRWQHNFNDEGFFTSDEEGEIAFNREKRDEVLAELATLPDNPKKIKPFLASVGIEVSDKVAIRVADGVFNNLSYKQQFKSSRGLFTLIKQRLEAKDSKGLDTEQVINPVVNNSAVRALAIEESKFNNHIFANSTRNGEGNIVYNYSFSKLLTKQFAKLQDADFVEKLSKLSFQKPITRWDEELQEMMPLNQKNWIWQLLNNKEAFSEVFEVSPFDTLKSSSQEGTKLSQMSEVDLELTKLQLFQKTRELRGVGRVSNFLFTIPSKTTSYVFTAPATEVVVSADKQIGEEAIDALYSIAVSELNRINNAKGRKIETNKYGAGSKYFFFFPTLNKEESPELWKTDGTVKLPTTKIEGKTVEAVIKEKIKATIQGEIEEKIKYWENIGFIKEGKLQNVNTDYVKNFALSDDVGNFKAAADYIINNTLFEFNLHQTFIGDPALYYKKSVEETWDDLGKRLAAQIAPGRDLNVNPGEQFISIKAQDRKGDIALNIAQLKAVIGEAAEAYTDITGTDAQEFTTVQEHTFVLYRAGLINTETYTKINNKVAKGERLDDGEIDQVFQPMKPVYTNLEINTQEDAMILEYIKSSSIPLLPQFTEGLEIDKLRVQMEAFERAKNIPVRLAFESANKTGGVAYAEIFKEDGSIHENIDFEKHHKTLAREGLRIQQDVPFDPEYSETVKATQPTKLLFDAVLGITDFAHKKKSGVELKAHWNALHKRMYELSASKLKEELTRPDGSLDVAKAHKLLEKEAITRQYTPAELASLKLNLEKTGFEYPFWALNSSKKFESILTSLFTNNIVKQKMHGKSLILVAEEGIKGKSKGIVYTKDYDPTTGLKPYTIEEGVVKPAQILVPWKYGKDIASYIDKDGYIDHAKLPSELLEQFAFRIPNQGHNSMSLVQVVGFLPKAMGDAVIAPRNFIVQMGSDFDIDKLYIYDYYTKIAEDGVISRELIDNMQSTKNEILDIHKVVLKHPQVAKQVVTPLGNSKDNPSAKELKKFYKKKIQNYLSPDYKKQKYMESVDGKSMVGMESLASTLNTIIQEKKLSFQRIGEDGPTPDSIIFGVKDGKGVKTLRLSNLSDPFSYKKRTKNLVISGGQSAAVDNEKDPILFYLNRNPVVAPALNALRQLGLEEDHVDYLLGQKEIRQFVEQVRNSKSILRGFSNTTEEFILDTLIENAEQNYLKTLSNAKDKEEYTRDRFYLHPTTPQDLAKNIFEKADPFITMAALVKFKQAFKLGRSLTQLQSAINIESRGVGKSVLEIRNKVEALVKLHKIKNIQNVTDVLGDFTERGFEPTTVSGHVIKQGLLTAHQILNKENELFNYSSRSFVKAVNEFEAIAQKDMTDTQVEKLWDELKSFLFAQSIADKRKDIFIGKDSLARRLKRFIKSKEGVGNPFLIRLSLEIASVDKRPDFISYNASKEEYVDELNIYRGFIELFMSPNEETRKLGNDLIAYFYLNGGIQRAREWGKYIHPALLKQFEGGEFLKRLKGIDFQDTAIIGDALPVSNFMKQFFQHNPWHLTTLDEKAGFTKKGNNIYLPAPDPTAPLPISLTENGDEYIPMFAVENSKAVKRRDVYIYKQTAEDGTRIYERIPVKGTTNFVEYSPDTQTLVNGNIKETKAVITADSLPIKPKDDTKTIVKEKFRSLTVQELLDEFVKGEEWKPLTTLLKTQEFKNIKASIDPNLKFTGGEFNRKQNTLKINPKTEKKSLAKVVAHEVVHAATEYAYTSEGYASLSQTKQQAVDNLKVIASALRTQVLEGKLESKGLKAVELLHLDELVTRMDSKDFTEEDFTKLIELTPKYYGLVGNKKGVIHEEFITQLFTEKTFQDVLNSIEYEDTKTFLDRILELIHQVLTGFQANEGTAFSAALKQAIVLVTPDIKPVISAEAKSSVKSLFSSNLKGPDADTLRLPAAKEVEQYKKVTDQFQNRFKFIDRSIAQAANQKDFVRVEQLKARRTEVEEELQTFEDSKVFKSALILANNDLDKVEDILKQPALSHNDINYSLRAIKMWSEASDIMLTKTDRKDKNANYKEVRKIVSRANDLYEDWVEVAKSSMLEAVQQESGLTGLTKEVLDAQEKINALTANMMDISRSGNILLSVMDKWMRDSIKRANIEAVELQKENDKLINELKKNNLFNKEGYYVFAQRTNDGQLTGELTRPLQAGYYSIRNKLRDKAVKTKSRKQKAENWKKYFKWVRENHTIFDIRKLFKDSSQGYVYSPDTDYLATLEDQFGDRFTVLLEEQQEKIRYYNERLALFTNTLDTTDPNHFREIERWKLANDPAIYLKNVLDDNYSLQQEGNRVIKNEGHEYVLKRATERWEDPQFKAIQSSPELKAYYDFAVNTLNRLYSFLPSGFKDGITPATIPSIPKTLLETFHDKGMTAALAQGNNTFIEALSVDNLSTQVNALQDPLTKKPEQNLHVKYLTKLTNEERSYDLGKVLNAFALEALAFKHKSQVEDSIRLAQSILEQSLEVARSAKGDQLINRFGEVVKVKDLKYLQDQVEYAIEAFYGKRKEVQGITSKKIYTNKAKTKYKKIMEEVKVGRFTNETIKLVESMGGIQLSAAMIDAQPGTIEQVKEFTEAYLSANTRYVAGSKVGDVLLKYMQIKGMGWNIFGSFTNVTFGWLSNFTHAAGGRDFTTGELLKANRIMLASTSKSLGVNNPTAKKVNALMQKYDVIKELNDAAYEPTTRNNAIRQGMDKLAPYELQRRGEYFVQGMTMVARMLNTKVTKDGKEITLWDAYNSEGNFIGDARDEWQGDADNKSHNTMFLKFSNRLDQVNKTIHGNYDPNSPVRIKKGILGRAIMQFRSWIAEGAANRFEAEKFDLLLGRKRKGRWRSYLDLGFLDSAKTLFRLAAGQETKLDELNKENMKRNLVELYQTLGLIGVYFVLKSLDFDDDDEWGKRSANFMINQTLRLQDDLEFYYSPMALENITQNAVPVFNAIRDGYRFVDATKDGIISGEWEYQGGRKHGENRILWTGAKVLPFGSTMASFLNKTETEEGFRK
jgi:hypothetical protein